MDEIDGPARQITFGTLFREPYSHYLGWLYARLQERGFPDIRVAHSAVVRTIDAEKGSRVTTLAERAGMTKQSMAYLVDSLIDLGYLEIVPDPKDKRAKLARLTRRGRKLMATAAALGAEYEALLAGRIGADKMAELRRLLTRVATALPDWKPGE
ncbi:MAG: MarR family winged helix-turn-helix transcriptional regulator [Parvibaculum sedimenti]|uniref:MarR family winged helix-turn-helix transcriptional regulator n=1 Tax=Parvibaculum sedimenti TaxID=2608632 RepID=UPI003BB6CE65